jgi:hypothetical protein
MKGAYQNIYVHASYKYYLNKLIIRLSSADLSQPWKYASTPNEWTSLSRRRMQICYRQDVCKQSRANHITVCAN